MPTFCGYPVREEVFELGGGRLALLVPTEPEALLDDPRVEARFARDEYLPYWAQLWPAAHLLVEHLTRSPACLGNTKSSGILEIGCGLGLTGLWVAAGGQGVLLTDYDGDALAFVQENARRNGLTNVRTRLLDWRATYADLRPGCILAADVLYEARNLEPVAGFVRGHLSAGGWALVADASRSTADRFVEVAEAHGLHCTTAALTCRGPAGTELSGRVFELWQRYGGSCDEMSRQDAGS